MNEQEKKETLLKEFIEIKQSLTAKIEELKTIEEEIEDHEFNLLATKTAKNLGSTEAERKANYRRENPELYQRLREQQKKVRTSKASLEIAEMLLKVNG